MVCALLVWCVRCAVGRDGGSYRQQEQRRRTLLSQLSASDRAMIVEMHTQGLSATHIDDAIGLNGGARYIAEVIEAMKALEWMSAHDRKEPARQRERKAANDAAAAERVQPRDIPRAHRERKRARKRLKTDL